MTRCARACTRSGCSRSIARGRQADALEAYRQRAATLVDQIGVEPGPELRRLHAAILRQDAWLASRRRAGRAAAGARAGTPLVGREAELDSLREHWRRARGGAGGSCSSRARGDRQDAARRRSWRRGASRARRVLYAPARREAPRRVATRAGAAPALVVFDDIDRGREARALLDELAAGWCSVLVRRDAGVAAGWALTHIALTR